MAQEQIETNPEGEGTGKKEIRADGTELNADSVGVPCGTTEEKLKFLLAEYSSLAQQFATLSDEVKSHISSKEKERNENSGLEKVINQVILKQHSSEPVANSHHLQQQILRQSQEIASLKQERLTLQGAIQSISESAWRDNQSLRCELSTLKKEQTQMRTEVVRVKEVLSRVTKRVLTPGSSLSVLAPPFASATDAASPSGFHPGAMPFLSARSQPASPMLSASGNGSMLLDGSRSVARDAFRLGEPTAGISGAAVGRTMNDAQYAGSSSPAMAAFNNHWPSSPPASPLPLSPLPDALQSYTPPSSPHTSMGVSGQPLDQDLGSFSRLSSTQPKKQTAIPIPQGRMRAMSDDILPLRVDDSPGKACSSTSSCPSGSRVAGGRNSLSSFAARTIEGMLSRPLIEVEASGSQQAPADDDPRVLQRIEWTIGNIKQLPQCLTPSDCVVSPPFATTCGLGDVRLQLNLGGNKPSYRKGDSPWDVQLGLFLTTPTVTRVTFTVFIGNCKGGPITHEFFTTPWNGCADMCSLDEQAVDDQLVVGAEILEVQQVERPRSRSSILPAKRSTRPPSCVMTPPPGLGIPDRQKIGMMKPSNPTRMYISEIPHGAHQSQTAATSPSNVISRAAPAGFSTKCVSPSASRGTSQTGVALPLTHEESPAVTEPDWFHSLLGDDGRRSETSPLKKSPQSTQEDIMTENAEKSATVI